MYVRALLLVDISKCFWLGYVFGKEHGGHVLWLLLVGVARYLLVRCFGIDKDDLYIRSLF